MPAMMMEHVVDPREAILKSLGSLDNIEIFNNRVLVAIYQRGGSDQQERKTAGGVIIPGETLGEDRHQSKVGLVIKMGDTAFRDENDVWFRNVDIKLGDWVLFRVSDGLPMEIIGTPPRINFQVNKIACRLLEDVRVLARIQHPDTVW